MPKIKYYSIKNLLSTGAQYLMLLGQRANGKSYQVKHTCIVDAYNGLTTNTGKFIYLRRWKEDVKVHNVEMYFNDCPISDITKGEWDGIMAYRGDIYFYKNVDNKVLKSSVIGSYCSLNEGERYKSMAFVGYENVIYEEFITGNLYLNDEPDRLQQFVSTIARHKTMRVFLVGNTLTRVCPYFSHWCLDGVLRQKIGTIELYHYDTGGDQVDIAVEYCENSTAKNTMFFGNTAKQIVSGEWDTKEVAKLPRQYDHYDILYELVAEYQQFKFIIQLLYEPENGGIICYIYPCTTDRYVYRIISDVFSDLPNVSYRLDLDNKAESMIERCFKIGKVCYSDNLTGADFTNVNKYFRLGQLI